MFLTAVFVTTAGLLQAAHSAELPDFKTVLINNVLIPATQSNFGKNNVSARWAPGYPKERGSEDFSYQFNIPDPEDNFNAVVTEDEKYLTMFNGTHVEFIDLGKNSTASLFAFQSPANTFLSGLWVRAVEQGGYDVLTGYHSRSIYEIPTQTWRQRVSTDLKAIGAPVIYQGPVGAIAKQGRMASTWGYIYDLETTSNDSIATLNDSGITDLSFSPDGVYLASVDNQAFDGAADLWNATSGERIFDFPNSGGQNWLARFSPDGKYVAIAVGGPSNTVQIYMLGNLTAPPIEITGFNDWPRTLDWSPSSQQIAIDDFGRLRVYNVPSKEIVQEWVIARVQGGTGYDTSVRWLPDGNITWQWFYVKYMYDFVSNTEWAWTIRGTDHSWGPEGFYGLKDKGFAVTVDGDSTVRFWKI